MLTRIVEHNIRIMAKYYTRITLTRMAELLALPESKAEDCLSEMVSRNYKESLKEEVL